MNLTIINKILFYITLASYLLLVMADDGIGWQEVAHYGLLGLCALTTIPSFLRFDYVTKSKIDRSAFLLFGLIIFNTALGLITNNISFVFKDLTYYSPIVLFFVGYNVINTKKEAKELLFVLFLICLSVCVYNLINYRQIIIESTAIWQVKKARSATSEIFMSFGLLYTFSRLTLDNKIKWKQIFIYAVCFISFGIALVITQSRGYWLSSLAGILVVFYFISLKKKALIISLSICGLAGLIIIANLYLGNQFYLILDGLYDRWSTLSSNKMDVSLYERVLEGKKVLSAIELSPILGRGFGYTYYRRYFFEDIHAFTTYVHNGILGAWLKLGILGVLNLFFINFYLLKSTYLQLRNTSQDNNSYLFATILGFIVCSFIVNNTSPQWYYNSGLMFIICATLFIRNYELKTTASEK